MSHSIPVIAYPAGKCPAKLKGTSYEEVTEWAEEIFSEGRNNNLIYLPSAIAFFAQQFYRIFTPEYRVICNHLISKYGNINYYEEEIGRQLGIIKQNRQVEAKEAKIEVKEKEVKEEVIEKVKKVRKIKLKKKE
jgi:hypothetical protein